MSDVTNRDDLQTLDAMGTFARREQQLLENVVAAATELVTWIVSQENDDACAKAGIAKVKDLLK